MGRRMTRRSLLWGAASLALTQVFSACQLWQRSPQFLVEFLASSIPATLLKKFQETIKQKAILKPLPVAQLAEGVLSRRPVEASVNPLQKLPLIGSRTPKTVPLPDVVSLGDSWLQMTIQGQQLQTLDLSNTSGWQTLPSAFQSLVTRNDQGYSDPNGKIWAAPYRWGHLMIAYRVDQMATVGQTITDWSDLWNSNLNGHISLLDSDRVVLGIVLKNLGESVNTTALDTVSELEQRLVSLNSQVKFYSSDSYLQPLLLKDTWVAVGWSMDILPLVRRDRRINAIVPKSGTILTADVWVQPVKSDSSDADSRASTDGLVHQWIDFFWERPIAEQLALLSSGASPVLLSSPRADLLPALANDTLLMPPVDIMNKSEFLAPLSEETIALYRRYWADMRR